MKYRTTFCYYLLLSIPILSLVINPVDPVSLLTDIKALLFILILAIYLALFSVFTTWLSISKKIQMLQSGSSIGVAVSFSIFPMFLLMYFMAGPILIVYYALAGFVHGKILVKVHNVKFGTYKALYRIP